MNKEMILKVIMLVFLAGTARLEAATWIPLGDPPVVFVAKEISQLGTKVDVWVKYVHSKPRFVSGSNREVLSSHVFFRLDCDSGTIAEIRSRHFADNEGGSLISTLGGSAPVAINPSGLNGRVWNAVCSLPVVREEMARSGRSAVAPLPSERIVLACALIGVDYYGNDDKEFNFEKTVVLDYGESTADGLPMEVSDTTVQWTAKETSYRLDRYSGSISGFWRGALASKGNCERRTDRAF